MPRSFLPYGLHSIDDEDRAAVDESLRGDWITSGPTIARFEAALGEVCSAPYVVAVNSGTAALDIAVGALELEPGSEAITTPLTFAATANACLYHGVRPVFADIDRHTWNLDPEEVRKRITSKTRLIICVDYSGQPADIDDLRALADAHGLHLIEDAAHSLGATSRGRPVGSLCEMTTLSFHPVKHVTTGEGGAVTTANEQLYRRLLLLRNHGIDRDASARYGPMAGWAYDIKVLGRNYRLTDFQCALGISQLRKLKRFIDKRRALVSRYQDRLPPDVTMVKQMPDRQSSWHLLPVLVPEGVSRDAVFTYMRQAGIGVNVHYIPVYRHTYYRKEIPTRPEDYPITERVFSRLLTLPLHPGMEMSDVDEVCGILGSACLERTP